MKRRRIVVGLAGLVALWVFVVVARLVWVAFFTTPVPEDVSRITFGMTRDEVIETLGRQPDAEWDRAVDPKDAAGSFPDGPRYLPVGATVRYLFWETEGETIAVRFYEGRVINKGASQSQPKTHWRKAVHSLRSL